MFKTKPVSVRLVLVEQDENEVETGEERILHGDVLHGRFEGVISENICLKISELKKTIALSPSINGIGSREDRASGVELCMDAGLGDGDSALLHHLVDGRPIYVRHLVEFVDAHNASATSASSYG